MKTRKHRDLDDGLVVAAKSKPRKSWSLWAPLFVVALAVFCTVVPEATASPTAPAAVLLRRAWALEEATAVAEPVEPAASFAAHRTVATVSSETAEDGHHRKLVTLGWLTKFVAKSAAAGALGKVAGEATGWILNMVGLMDNTGEKLDDIKAQLAEQKTMLHDIQRGLKQLEGQIAEAVEQILSAIEDAHDKTRFMTWAATLNQNVGTLLGYSDSLYVWSQMEPSEGLEADIKEFRSSILNSVPGAIRAIDGALMGTGFAEGMIALFARIQFKEAGSLDAYAESFYLMFQYYYSYEVLGLQLMAEAYHASISPNYSATAAYYDIWQGLVTTQIDEYMKRAPMSHLVDSWQADPKDDTIGLHRFLQVTKDRAYFFNFTGYVHAATLEGASLQTVYSGIGMAQGFFNTYPLFRFFNDALYVGGCTDMYCASGIIVQKYDTDLNLVDQVTIPPIAGATKQEARGFDFADNRLYVVQFAMEPVYRSTIQVVDLALGRMTHNLEESFSLGSSSFLPGDLKMVAPDVAVMGFDVARGAWVVDTKSKETLALIPSPVGSYTTPSGLDLSVRTDLVPSERIYLEANDPVNGTSQLYVLRVLAYQSEWRYPHTWRFAEVAGTIAYTDGSPEGTATLVNAESTNQLPFTYPLEGLTAMDLANGFLYVSGEPYGTVLKYEYAFPFERPVSLWNVTS